MYVFMYVCYYGRTVFQIIITVMNYLLTESGYFVYNIHQETS